MENLKDNAILVCGGATGIGAATVRRLAEQGARVAIGDLNIEAASALAAQLGNEGAQVDAWQYDQADEASINALVKAVIAHFGRLDGLFCNVADLKAVLEDGDLLSNDSAMWERTLRVNVTGTVILMKAALPQMLDQGAGAIVLTSSDAGVIGEPERPAYAASKAAVNSLCRHVASKWGRQGIRCNVVAPGIILTQATLESVPDIAQSFGKHLALARMGRPEDVANLVAYLASEESSYMTGQCLSIDGGSLIHQPHFADYTND